MGAPDTAALEALRERVRVRDGASYQLELDIAAALNLAPEGMALHPVYALFMDAGSFDANAKTWRPPAYTASIDAATALVERTLPDCIWDVTSTGQAWIMLAADTHCIGKGKSPVLALLDALLSALIEARHD